MKNFKLLIFIFLFVYNNEALSQKWIYSEGENPFDGKYRTSIIQGKGREFPFVKPNFMVNYFEKSNKVSVYIRDVGYAGCDNKIVKIKFDKNDTIYTFGAIANKNENIWFLNEIAYLNITIQQLLEKIIKCTKMYIRISSDCGTNDLEFSLQGSAEAIKFVLPENFLLFPKLLD
jgi:hypothetical protein